MSQTEPDDWSPADNPYAIAVSEAQWWLRAATLTVGRLRAAPGRVGGFGSHQIDARLLVLALRQVMTAEELEQKALRALGMNKATRTALAAARAKFEADLPGIKDMRDGLVHFEEWSLGRGNGPQKARRAEGQIDRDVARQYWGFGYDAANGTVTSGPYTIEIGKADVAAEELTWAIWMAARDVDARRAKDDLDRVASDSPTDPAARTGSNGIARGCS